jgi:hypothetical protein
MNKTIDIGKAISHLFDDPEWVSKTVIGAVLSIVPILNFTVVGYELRLIRNVSQGQARPLPAWDDIGEMFVEGLWLGIARLIYALPVIFGIVLGIMTFYGSIFVGAVAADSQRGDPNNAAAVFIPLAFLGGSVFCGLAILYSLVFSFLSPAIAANFVRHKTFASCFNFGQIIALIRRNPNPYLMVWVTALLAGFIYLGISSVSSFLLCLNFLVLYPAIFWVYTMIAHAVGQFLALDAPELSQPPSQSLPPESPASSGSAPDAASDSPATLIGGSS